jgi:hypothetical protein
LSRAGVSRPTTSSASSRTWSPSCATRSESARESRGAARRGPPPAPGASVDTPLATADRARRKARVPGFPISAYDQLSIRQVESRLSDLSRDELRKVRGYERSHKARKGLLRSIDRRLKSG